MKIIFDIECDTLNATKIHCLSYSVFEDVVIPEIPTVHSITDYEEIKKFLSNPNIEYLIGHNIVLYDIPILKRLLNIDIKIPLIDTLGLSWYLYPNILKPGLENWGEILGIQKIKIEDWVNLDISEYVKRCETDVKITHLLFQRQKDYLEEIYGKNNYHRICSYLSFKLDCAREQEEEKWMLNKILCQTTLSLLEEEQQEKILSLTSVLPDKVFYKVVEKPEKMLKADNSLSVRGQKWLEILKSKNLPLDFSQNITIENKREEGNPVSTAQIKDFLFSLGWIPSFYKITKVKKGMKKVPQIAVDEEICPNIKKLYPICPELKKLEDLTIITHRANILKGFLRDVDRNGYLTARIKGLTNTLRFQHTELVNLPSINRPYGKEVRGCLTCKEDEILCGSDISSLEDKTKRHYMYFFDPDYVKEMENPDFDPHLDIAEKAQMLTHEQVIEHKTGVVKHNKIRKDAKQVNFACTYGAGIPKIVLTSGMALEVATILHQTFWKRNWAVKKVTKNIKTKVIDNQMWLYNPVSKFWYSLRYEKDKFSTLNQSSGVFVFDTWIREVRKRGVKICGQFHDEKISKLTNTPEKIEERRILLLEAMKRTNEILKLNVEIGISIDFGKTYADIH